MLFRNPRQVLSLIVLPLAFAPSMSQASGSESHGGSVVVCGDRVELAEFREVRMRPGLADKVRIHQSADAVNAQIAKVLVKVDAVSKLLGDKIRKYVTEIRAAAMPTTGYDWGFSNDVNFYPIEAGCQLKTTVYYFDSDMIEYRSDLYDRLSPTDQAGIWVHEAVYRWARESTDQKGTLLTRRIVSLLFSDAENPELLKSLFSAYRPIKRPFDEGQYQKTWGWMHDKEGFITFDSELYDHLLETGGFPTEVKVWAQCRLAGCRLSDASLSIFGMAASYAHLTNLDGTPSYATIPLNRDTYVFQPGVFIRASGANISYRWEIRLVTPEGDKPLMSEGSAETGDKVNLHSVDGPFVTKRQIAAAAAFLKGVQK